MVGRVARDPQLAGAHGHPRIELLQPGHHDRVGVSWDEHLQDAPAGRRDDRRGQGGVPAARDREVWPVLGVDATQPLDHLEMDQDTEEVAGLV